MDFAIRKKSEAIINNINHGPLIHWSFNWTFLDLTEFHYPVHKKKITLSLRAVEGQLRHSM